METYVTLQRRHARVLARRFLRVGVALGVYLGDRSSLPSGGSVTGYAPSLTRSYRGSSMSVRLRSGSSALRTRSTRRLRSGRFADSSKGSARRDRCVLALVAMPLPPPARDESTSGPVELADWQRGLLVRYPEALLRGLVHSDGCRFINTGTNWRHPRSSFSDLSSDIRRLFCDGAMCYGSAGPSRRARSTCRASATWHVLRAHWPEGLSHLSRSGGPARARTDLSARAAGCSVRKASSQNGALTPTHACRPRSGGACGARERLAGVASMDGDRARGSEQSYARSPAREPAMKTFAQVLQASANRPYIAAASGRSRTMASRAAADRSGGRRRRHQ